MECSVHSSWNGVSIPFRLEWNWVIPFLQEWNELSILARMEWPLHSCRNGVSCALPGLFWPVLSFPVRTCPNRCHLSQPDLSWPVLICPGMSCYKLFWIKLSVTVSVSLFVNTSLQNPKWPPGAPKWLTGSRKPLVPILPEVHWCHQMWCSYIPRHFDHSEACGRFVGGVQIILFHRASLVFY